MSRGVRGAVIASPILIGAITVLISIVAVFLAYNANEGLPFVPTYEVKAELPNGAKLVAGNEVRTSGGFRVGTIVDIRGARKRVGDETRSLALVELKLDKKVEPLPVDTRVTVRPRSALGLKYLELTPGSSERSYDPGDTIPLANAAGQPEDLEDVLSTFPEETREDARRALEFGTSLAGRGPDINITIGELRPFLRRLEPVMRNLSASGTELERFFPALGRATAEAAPVARVQAALFASMADTFAAIGRNPDALRETIDDSPETLQASIDSFLVQTPFLEDFTDLSRRLRPGAEQLDRSLPLVNDALSAGVPAFRQTPELAGQLEQLFAALEDFGENPNSLLALRDLRRAVQVTRPAVQFVAPYQTVCNYFVYFFNPLGTHQSSVVDGGTTERILAKLVSPTQDNTLGNTESRRPVDVPANEDPRAQDPVQQALHTQNMGPAVDGEGRADCQAGQTGYIDRLVTDPRYPPDTGEGDSFVGGGSHTVLDPDTPGRAGGTFKSRELGIDSVEDVP